MFSEGEFRNRLNIARVRKELIWNPKTIKDVRRQPIWHPSC